MPTSYQHNHFGRQHYQEGSGCHDYLTCGLCSKEFLLENITLFIAHKSACDVLTSHNEKLRRGWDDLQDASSPLTCSTCSRVYVTARGLLHHVQKVHRMNICLQKGPLIIRDDLCPIQPPPAHSSVSSHEYSMCTDHHRPASQQPPPVVSTDSLQNSCGDGPASDQPTDLSLTFNGHENDDVSSEISNKHSKLVSDLEHYDKKQSTYEGCGKSNGEVCSTVILPKKRRFFAQGDETDNSGASSTNDESEEDGIFPEMEDGTPSSWKESKDVECEEINRQETSMMMSPVSKSDTQCCNVLYIPETQDHKKNTKLKMLLRGDFAGIDPTTGTNPYDVTNKDVYNLFPFQDSKTPSGLKHIMNESLDRNVSTSTATEQPISGISLQDNIDRIIRNSVVSEPYSDMMRMETRQHGSPKLKMDQTQFQFPPKSAPLCPLSSSPKIIAPAPRRYSQPTTPPRTGPEVDMLRLVVAEKSLAAAAAHGMHRLSIEASSKGYLPTTLPTLITGSSVVYSREEQPQTASVPSVKCPPVLSAAHHFKTTVTSSAFQVLENLPHQVTPHHVTRPSHVTSSAPTAEMIVTPSKGSGLVVDKALRSAFSGGRSDALTAIPVTSVSLTTIQPGLNSPVLRTMASFYTGLQDDQWLTASSSDENTTTSDYGAISSRPMRFMDLTGHGDYDLVSMETGDDKEGKGMKKRRYPTSRPFKCEHCDQAFNQRIHLKKHMSKHTGVKPFKCQQCDYSTVERSHLKVHLRIHTGEKPYRCSYCGYATAQNSTLKIHLKRHHEGIDVRSRSDSGLRSAREDSYTGLINNGDSSAHTGHATTTSTRCISELMVPRVLETFSSSSVHLGPPLESTASSGDERRRRSSELDRSTRGQSEVDGHSEDSTLQNGVVFNPNKSIRLSSSSSNGDVDDSSLLSTSQKTSKDLDTSATNDRSKSTIICSYSNHSSKIERALDLSEHSSPFSKSQELTTMPKEQVFKSKLHFDEDLPHSHGSESSPEEVRSKDTEPSYLSECGATSCPSKDLQEAEVVAAAKAGEPSMSVDDDDEDEVDDLDYRPSLLSVTIPDKAFVRG